MTHLRATGDVSSAKQWATRWPGSCDYRLCAAGSKSSAVAIPKEFSLEDLHRPNWMELEFNFIDWKLWHKLVSSVLKLKARSLNLIGRVLFWSLASWKEFAFCVHETQSHSDCASFLTCTSRELSQRAGAGQYRLNGKWGTTDWSIGPSNRHQSESLNGASHSSNVNSIYRIANFPKSNCSSTAMTVRRLGN